MPGPLWVIWTRWGLKAIATEVAREVAIHGAKTAARHIVGRLEKDDSKIEKPTGKSVAISKKKKPDDWYR